jgi:outer membrane protein
MKRLLSIVCVFASGLGAGAVAQAARPAVASAVPVTGTTRVAVINFQQAVGQTNEFQRDLAQLRQKYEPRQKALQQQAEQIKQLQKQLQQTSASLTPLQREEKVNAINDKEKSFQRAAQDLRSDEQSAAQEKFQEVEQKVFNEVSTYAHEKGFGLVLDSGLQTSSVVYSAPGTDMTEAVVKAYNAKSGIAPVPAPVPSAPAPSAPPKQ